MLGFREIEAFRAVVTSGSFSAAARMLNTSQPNVTRLIARLEKALKYSIFVRKSRGVIPTAEGEMLFAEVDISFRGLAEITQAAREIGEYNRTQLSIGIASATMMEVLPHAVRQWRSSHSELSISFQFHDSQRIVQWIRAKRFHLGFVNPLSDISDVAVLARRKVRYFLLAAPDNKALSGDSRPVSIRRLGEMDLIVPGLNYISMHCKDAKMAEIIGRRSKLEGYYSLTSAYLAMGGLGVAIVDSLTAGYFARAFGATIRPFASPIESEIALIAPNQSTPDRAAANFSKLLIEAIDSFSYTLSTNQL